MSRRLSLITEMALISSLTLILDKLVLFHLPQGGSISLAMLAIAFFSLRRGIKYGIACGAIIGILQLFFGAYFLNPVQYFFDYILAYASIGLTGIGHQALQHQLSTIKQNIIISASCLLGGTTRLICHTIAGIVFYRSFAPEGTPVWIYSLIYNASFMIPTIIITIVGLIFMIRFNKSDLIIK